MWTNPVTGIHFCNDSHVLLVEGKVKDLKVLLGALRRRRFRNSNVASLNVPTENHLSNRFAMLGANRCKCQQSINSPLEGDFRQLIPQSPVKEFPT